MALKLGLSPEEHAARRLGIGGSDAGRIMNGDWHSLWQEKRGLVEPKSILGAWEAALRYATEPLSLDWFEHRYAQSVTRRGENAVSSTYPFMRATLDGYIGLLPGPINAKHVSEFTKEPEAWCREHYTAQMHHEMLVTGSEKSILHVIVGCKEPVAIEIPLDPFYADELVRREREFWQLVEGNQEPVNGRPVTLPPVPQEKWRRLDMTGNNEWGAFAAQWVENRVGAKRFDQATVGLKGLVEHDVGEATGHGVKVSRNKAGSLSVREA